MGPKRLVKFGDGVGIVGYATYVPRWRLERSARPVQFRGRSRESRAVAGPDEDTTTLAAEAARRALRTTAEPLSYLYFATTRPTYVEKSNATAVAAAAGCDATLGAFDAGGGLRSAFGAFVAAAGTAPAMAVAADLRFGLPGSEDDEQGGDAAAAFVFGADPLAEIVATTSLSEEFLERWRRPGDASGQHVGRPLRVARVRPAPGSGDRRRARCGRHGGRPDRPRRHHLPELPFGRGHAGPVSRRPRSFPILPRPSGTQVPPNPGSCSPLRWTAPARTRRSCSSRPPTVSTRWC